LRVSKGADAEEVASFIREVREEIEHEGPDSS